MSSTQLNNSICTHERPKRSKFGINTGKLGFEKDYFCKECKWFVGYFSRLIWRKKTFHLEGSL